MIYKFANFYYFSMKIFTELAMGPRISCESKRAFFYDELATMIRENKPNAKFAEMWNDRTYKLALEFLFARNIDLEYVEKIVINFLAIICF